MADTAKETLKTFVREIADSIRYVEESEDPINPQDFEERIKALKPEGQLEVTDNGIYDVKDKATVNVAVITGDVDRYTGSTTVEPKFTEQVLETKNKVVTSNITVSKISTTQVHNDKGCEIIIGKI